LAAGGVLAQTNEPPSPPGETGETQPDPSLSERVADILRTHCATCHGREATATGAPPAGFIGAIDDLDWLASSPMVVPADPDRSRLFAVLQERHAPLDVFKPWGREDGPTADEMMAVRRWIASLAPDPRSGCADGRASVSPSDLHRTALNAVALIAPETREQVRFLSLAHFWNACASPDELNRYKAALFEALRGLSWRPGDVPIGSVAVIIRGNTRPQDLLFSVRLDHVGIAPEAWDRVARASAVGRAGLTRQLNARFRQAFGARTAVAAADAFVARAFGSFEVYGALLKLPETMDTLARRLGLPDDWEGQASHTLDVAKSAVTNGPRCLKRFRSRTTTLWLAEDGLPPAADETGPIDAAEMSVARTRALFRLPNGAPAFAIFGSSPAAIDHAADNRRLAPAHCAACHADGPRMRDETTPNSADEPVSTDDDAAAKSETDALRAFVAEAAADRKPAERRRGLDAVSQLVAAFYAPIDLKRAAAEIGQSVPVLTGVLSERIAGGDWLARRLSQGQISRAQFETLRAGLDGSDQAARPPVSLAMGLHDQRQSLSRTGLAIWTEQEVFPAGAPLQIHLTASARCYPTVINVDARGRGIVLYPNGLDEWRPIVPGTAFMLPPSGAEYALRTRATGAASLATGPGEPGRLPIEAGGPTGPGDVQTLHAFCAAENEPVFGLRPDYTEQVFTILGDWDAFLKSAYARQADARDPEILRAEQDALRRRSWRARRRPKEPIFDARPRLLMRDSAVFEVR
jgi:mono/diheme cytochrome c family protein